MKELSIKEKAQRYDEAIERVVNIRTGKCETTFIFTEGLFNYLFPELEESNGEEVRKAMIDFFKHEREEDVVVSHYGVNIERMIAWLEKQGEPTDINPSEFDLRLNKLLKQFETLPKEELASSLSFYLNVVQNDGTYREEKQGEQKPVDKVEPKDYNSIDPHFGKPIDKVVPKFQNGQWIVWQDKCYEINNNSCGYELLDQDNFITQLEYGTVEVNARLWDITKDAKDGDVLVASDGSIFLFKGTIDCVCKHYAALTTDGTVKFNEGLEHFWETSTAVHPAIKEQRETLFKTMHEAGYEWDAEKKEFKKIKNPAWSEEDEAVVKDICDKLSWLRVIYTGNQNIACQKDIYWLKSLKGRVGCEANFTTMWKPSEKQIMCLQDALSDYHRRGYKAETLETLLKQLKQL